MRTDTEHLTMGIRREETLKELFKSLSLVAFFLPKMKSEYEALCEKFIKIL